MFITIQDINYSEKKKFNKSKTFLNSIKLLINFKKNLNF